MEQPQRRWQKREQIRQQLQLLEESQQKQRELLDLGQQQEEPSQQDLSQQPKKQLQQQNQQRRSQWTKISPAGRFLYFPGATIIWKLQRPVLADWAKLLEEVQSIAGRWVSVLPVESLHVTLLAGPDPKNMNLCSELEETDLLNEQRKWFQSRAREWERAMSILQDWSSFAPAFTLKAVRTRTGAKLDLAMASTEEAAAKRLRTQLREACPRCCLETRERPWHMTLAYATPAAFGAAGMPENVAAQLQHVCSRYVGALSLRVDPAALCRFDDMTDFVPWDGGNLKPDEWQSYVGYRQQHLDSSRVAYMCSREDISTPQGWSGGNPPGPGA
mmetsp:Transcript_50750/g.120629  ORF Transcript_50750/g.120629 Transcript_50750/m.120629 type:complete len:330 (-) Transcript_50750:128-1117(-)